MQYHLNGLPADASVDPSLHNPVLKRPIDTSPLPTEVDVLIIGAGPAGLLLAAQLSRFSSLKTLIIDAKPSSLAQGQADGLQCRTIEIFQAFGFAEKVLKEAYWVNETTFWSPGKDGKGLMRTGRIRDTEEGLSEFPHVILNQARLHGLWEEAMAGNEAGLKVRYGWGMKGLRIPEKEDIEVEVEKIEGGEVQTIMAKYVVGCDGARSPVRQSLGLEMKGDFANQGWGVLDALVVTDFPDLRLKTAIHSANDGSILIIPREGGYLARFYIELDKMESNERLSSKNITAADLIARAKKIFAPYTFDVKHIGYWNKYEVGQRLTNHFDNVPAVKRNALNPRVFIAGDACHTHSAKAGQGMNVSMNDAFNLGWKLVSVLRGQADPKLLHTYSEERHAIAQLLIDFDREISRQFAAKPKSKINGTNTAAEAKETDKDAVDPALFQEYFTRQGRFMAGVETTYKPSLATSSSTKHQHLASGFEIGTRFHSAQVLRLADAKLVQLGHVMEADGRWRIVLFGSTQSPLSADSAVSKTCAWLEKVLVPRYTPPNADVDSIFDVRAVFQQPRAELNISDLPEVLLPHKGELGIQDYEKVFTDEASYGFGFGEIYKTRGIDCERGAVVVVRPDQYVSAVLPLGEEGWDEMETLFSGFMVEIGKGTNGQATH
ncbi:hypothetical protein LTR95_008820 [Oleoguttula sp. CCFEE 5521]